MLTVGRWACGRGRRDRNGRARRVNPARLNPRIQAIGGLRVDVVSMQNQTAKRGVDVGARTAKSVVQIEMAKGGIEIVAPKQTDHAATQPDTFGIAGRTGQRMLRLGKFV